MPERQISAPVELQPEEAKSLAIAAFRDDDPVALERTHRTLYALYADHVWRTPNSPTRARMEVARTTLERGFRDNLHRRREQHEAQLLPPASTSLTTWFEKQALGEHPAESGEWSEHVREGITLDQLKCIVSQRSLFFLREPDPWIYAVPTLVGVAKAGLIDLLLDEYGWGKLDRMHSSVYARLMDALGLVSERDHYESESSWRYLATLNHQWMCALDGSLSRRLLGTIYLTEADSPQAMRNYLAAWARLGIDDPDVLEFYELHVEADENHSAVALDEVVLPVCAAEGEESIAEITKGIFDARTLEADFTEHELSRARESVSSVA